MRQALKFWTSKGFPRDFWNYHVNVITGFSTAEAGIDDKAEVRKYYKETQNTSL